MRGSFPFIAVSRATISSMIEVEVEFLSSSCGQDFLAFAFYCGFLFLCSLELSCRLLQRVFPGPSWSHLETTIQEVIGWQYDGNFSDCCLSTALPSFMVTYEGFGN